ncbi:MAG: ribonuclease HII [Bacteroidales bacterium]|nr:ribonuclease HII [Bacteroidales bacterium]
MLKSYLNQKAIEAGCDEAGRGCLAGPVCAAAVIMPSDYSNPLLNDSKKMSSQNRILLRKEIEKVALDYAVVFVDNHTIDDINILQASILAMHNALDKLKIRPEHILVDGNKFNLYSNTPHTCIVKGDGKFVSIAAASVLAKTYRDDFMLGLHQRFAKYKWNKNKGYPTIEHRNAIAEFGITSYHRRSFQLINTQMGMEFITDK